MYRFSLEPVLNHRKLVEEELQKELGASSRRLFSEQEKLSVLKETKNRCLRQLQQQQKEGIRALEMSLYSDFIGQVVQRIEAQKKQVLLAERNLARKRKKLIEAMKERKVVEQLKKNRMKAYLKEEQRREQKSMDEMAITGYMKSKQETAV